MIGMKRREGVESTETNERLLMMMVAVVVVVMVAVVVSVRGFRSGTCRQGNRLAAS
jgi:hypothetical protein